MIAFNPSYDTLQSVAYCSWFDAKTGKMAAWFVAALFRLEDGRVLVNNGRFLDYMYLP